MPLLEKDPTKKIRAKELFTEVQRAFKEDELSEVILALSANPEGENTATYLRKILEPLQEKLKIKISSLGRGLSTGTELEYSDTDTIEHALESRS